ncbi:MAG: GNAT family N-acetyltransferase [Chloroflexi bacterium]|nr:GNAT family N-acetyltransferase [Chloroflexota bacterium]
MDLLGRKPAPQDVSVTPYTRTYRRAVRELLWRTQYLHTHLDWHDTDHWIETSDAPMRLAWQRDRLVGLLALSQPLGGSTWIRLAAIRDQADPAEVLAALWGAFLPLLRAQGIQQVALLLLRDWLKPLAPQFGFRYVEDVVTLRRDPQPIPAPLPVAGLMIRAVEYEDLDRLTLIDQSAFSPPWQMTRAELEQAERISAICTVALLHEQMVGYQLSTLYFDGSHLARLAVAPRAQGAGVGGALLTDVLRRFDQRGVGAMTVNTQSTNKRSQRLYERFGFTLNGYDLPVWAAAINPVEDAT